VLLSPATPSRLLTAFPQGTPIHRVTLDEAVRRIKSGLSSATNMRQGNDELIADEDIPF
jgi:ATP-dependent DNA helicase DinG